MIFNELPENELKLRHVYNIKAPSKSMSVCVFRSPFALQLCNFEQLLSELYVVLLHVKRETD